MKVNIKGQIQRAKALADTKIANFNRDLASLKNEIAKARKDASEAKADLAKGSPSRALVATIKGLKGREHYLQMKVDAVETAYDEVLAIKDDLIALKTEEAEAEQRGVYERMRGLLSYGLATGQTSPDCRLLYDTLGDYLEAKSDGDRKAAHRAVDLIFLHGDLGDRRNGETGAGDEILRRFEAMPDGEERTAFYAKHQQEIVAVYDRKNLS